MCLQVGQAEAPALSRQHVQHAVLYGRNVWQLQRVKTRMLNEEVLIPVLQQWRRPVCVKTAHAPCTHVAHLQADLLPLASHKQIQARPAARPAQMHCYSGRAPLSTDLQTTMAFDLYHHQTIVLWMLTSDHTHTPSRLHARPHLQAQQHLVGLRVGGGQCARLRESGWTGTREGRVTGSEGE